MRFFDARVRGHNDKVQREWEQTRIVAYTIAKTNDVKNKLKSPQSFWPFPWDEQKVSLKDVVLSEADRKELEERFARLGQNSKKPNSGDNSGS